MQVDDVGGAATVDVRQAYALVVELVAMVESCRKTLLVFKGHRDLGTEAAVTKVGPVADFAVADAHQVAKAVTAHVGEIDSLSAIGEDQTRPVLLIQCLGDAAGGTKPAFGQ